MKNSIQQLLDKVLHKDNWRTKLLKEWPIIVGNLHTKMHIQKITTNNILIISVIDSCWLQELYSLSSILLKTINDALEKPHITKLLFRLASRITTTSKQRKKTKQRTYSKNIKLYPRENHALKTIEDQELKKALYDFCIRCHRERS